MLRNCPQFIAPLLVAGLLLLPTAGARGDGMNAAERAWEALTNFSLSPPPLLWQTNAPTPADLAKFDGERAAEAIVLADRAKDFYTEFPGDPDASRARVTEIQALQTAVHLGATNRLADLLAREQALVQNTNAPEELRYELRLDLAGRELTAASASGADMMVALEKAGREMIKEFPDGPAGYEMLSRVAESEDLLKMHDLGKLMADSSGPPELTGIGKGFLRRLNVLGEPLPIAFTAADGREVNLTTLSNKVVLVDFWGTWCPLCVQEMPELKKLYEQYHTNGFEIVGINFDDDTNAAQRFIKQQDITWPQYFGGKTNNKYAELYSLSYFPYIWLTDRKGIVQDIRGQEALAAKVAKLMAE